MSRKKTIFRDIQEDFKYPDREEKSAVQMQAHCNFWERKNVVSRLVFNLGFSQDFMPYDSCDNWGQHINCCK